MFSANKKTELEQLVNAWLQTHPAMPGSVQMQLSVTKIDDLDVYRLIYTLLLLYVPMSAIG